MRLCALSDSTTPDFLSPLIAPFPACVLGSTWVKSVVFPVCRPPGFHLGTPLFLQLESFKSSALTWNHKQHDPLHIVSLIWLIEWHLICLVFESVLLLVTEVYSNTLVVSRAVFYRVAEVLTVQADVLLLQHMPEKGLGSPQNCVQTCPAKVSVSFKNFIRGYFKIWVGAVCSIGSNQVNRHKYVNVAPFYFFYWSII